MGPWTRDPDLGQLWKLGFCLESGCEIFAHRGHIFKFLDCEHVASVPTWNLPKHTCMKHWNPVLMHGFDFVCWVVFQHVSLRA